ncbi:MAG TPA: xanthine dehydrogenase family protein subunit M [Bryobacterales bacterium]|jgi:carbon-monoxide dehydrogenase medium subunit|nr:xanthine dehydrogenase family protein subunit M [Bryobacterales bacterium]
MISQPFEYYAPESVSEALRLLAAHEDSRVLAGGQSLIPMMKLRLSAPASLIDLGHIAELNYIVETNGSIRIGAMSTHNQIETSETLRQRCPLLAEAAGRIGDIQVRNLGTMGGSLSHADPAADYPAALQALRAQVRLVSAKGERTLPIDEFLVDAFSTALEPKEILYEVLVPVDPPGTGWAYLKQQQPASGFAVAGVAAQLGVKGGSISFARVGITGVASRPYAATAVEAALQGKPATPAVLGEAARLAAQGVEPLADVYAAPEYRAHLAQVWTRRALDTALSRVK